MPSEMRVTSCSPSGVARRLRSGIMLRTLAGDLVGAVTGLRDDAHLLVVLVVADPVGLDRGLVEVVVLAVLERDAADPLGAVACGDHGDDEAGVVAEVHREPAVVPGRLPEPRAPGVVAEAVAVYLPLLVADADHAARTDVLLVVTTGEAAGEILRERRPVLVHRLAAERRDEAAVPDVRGAVDPRVLGERLAGVRHLQRLVEQHDLAV